MTEPGKREWLNAWLDGLEQSAFTGTVTLILYLDRGSISRLVVKEERETP